MALIPYNRRHRGDLAGLHHNMDDLFNAFFGGWPTYEHKLWPVVDVADEENAVVVKAELPGCKADDINISVHGNIMTISGEKRQSEEKKEKGYYHVESSYGSFRRDLNLSTEVDTTKVEAAYKDGILTVTLPKAERAKAIKVKVKE
jgi:HSP20 family protein